MTKRMLIDTTHAEETRVVVLDGNRLDDYDVETSSKKQIKGNIYLAKIVRIEPSLQAAFVEYGGNRHGFLAFSEIHPDYYQIPVADRERLLALQEEEARAEEARADNEDEGHENDGPENRRPENRSYGDARHEDPGQEDGEREEAARNGDEDGSAGVAPPAGQDLSEEPAPEAATAVPDEPRDEFYAGSVDVDAGSGNATAPATDPEPAPEDGSVTEMPLEIEADTVEGDVLEADPAPGRAADEAVGRGRGRGRAFRQAGTRNRRRRKRR